MSSSTCEMIIRVSRSWYDSLRKDGSESLPSRLNERLRAKGQRREEGTQERRRQAMPTAIRTTEEAPESYPQPPLPPGKGRSKTSPETFRDTFTQTQKGERHAMLSNVAEERNSNFELISMPLSIQFPFPFQKRMSGVWVLPVPPGLQRTQPATNRREISTKEESTLSPNKLRVTSVYPSSFTDRHREQPSTCSLY